MPSFFNTKLHRHYFTHDHEQALLCEHLSGIPSLKLLLSTSSTMLPYIPIFGVLVLACTQTAYRQHPLDRAPRKPDEETELRLKTDAAEAAAKHLKWNFLPVYLLVMGSDWLQVSPSRL